MISWEKLQTNKVQTLQHEQHCEHQSCQAADRPHRVGENQVNTEVHIPKVTLISSSQRLSSSYSMACVTHFFCLIIIIILKIHAAIFFPYLVPNSSVTSTVSLCLLMCLGKAYPFDSLSSNLTYGLFLFVVLGWHSKGFNPAFLHARLEDCLVQLAAKNLDCSPMGTPIQPVSSFQGARDDLLMQLLLCLWHPSTDHQILFCCQPVRKGEGQWFLLTGKGVEEMKETLIWPIDRI